MRTDILTVGDALLDIFLSINTADEHCHINEDKCEMCFIVGSKIPVEDCKFLLGGDACNVSVGLARLGLEVALVAELGDDEFSQKIISGLHNERINLSFLKKTLHTQASFSINLTILKDRTIFSRHVTRKHDIVFESIDCSFVYLTSLGEEWKELYERVKKYISDKKVKLAFNPGSRQLKAGVDSFREILLSTEVLFVNKEEAEFIVYGTDQNIPDTLKKPEKLLQEVKKLGPKIVSMTDGDKGSYVIDTNDTIFFQGIIPCSFVQKTGVGDAYASGFLAGLFNGQTMQEVMQWGAINGAAVIEHIGAQGGLLTKKQILERMERL